MDTQERVYKGFSEILYWVAGIAIVSMMLLTCVDVALRFCVTIYHKYRWEILGFFHPIPGTYELVYFMGSVAVAFALAHTSGQKGHVAVSIVVDSLPKRAQAIIGTITSSFGLILFVLLSWQSVVYARHLKAIGEVSLTLQLPIYPFIYGVAFSAAAVCLVLFVEVSKNLIKVFSK